MASCYDFFVIVLVAKSCQTFDNPMDCSLPGSFVMEFPRQEYWNGLPFSSPGDLPDSRIEPRSPALQADSLPSESPGKPLLFSYLECPVRACILSGFSCVQLSVTSETIAHQVSLSMEFFRQGYWRG